MSETLLDRCADSSGFMQLVTNILINNQNFFKLLVMLSLV